MHTLHNKRTCLDNCLPHQPLNVHLCWQLAQHLSNLPALLAAAPQHGPHDAQPQHERPDEADHKNRDVGDAHLVKHALNGATEHLCWRLSEEEAQGGGGGDETVLEIKRAEMC